MGWCRVNRQMCACLLMADGPKVPDSRLNDGAASARCAQMTFMYKDARDVNNGKG